MVMNPEIPLKQLWETSSLLECLHSAQEGFCHTELSTSTQELWHATYVNDIKPPEFEKCLTVWDGQTVMCSAVFM